MKLSRKRLMAMLATLTLANIFNYADRSLMFVLGEQIRQDLGFSDSQLGLLHGLAFALIYALLGLPLSRLADRGFQRRIVSVSLVAWSLLTTLGGFAQNFLQLAFMRAGVAAGEAGLHPSSHSLISNHFPEKSRGLALGIFTLGLPVGIALGSVLGSWIASEYGWRTAFLVIGPMALVIVPLAMTTLPRGERRVTEAAQIPLIQATRQLWTIPAFRYVWIGYAFATAFGYGIGTFFVSFFMRSHGLSAFEAGAMYGALNAIIGVIGILAGGAFYDAAFRRGRPLLPTVLALAVSGVIGPVAWFVPDMWLSLALIAVSLLLYLLVGVPTIAVTQWVAPPSMRATSSAVIGLSGGLFGATAGPLLGGMISDIFATDAQMGALPIAMTVLCLLQVVAAFFYLLASRALRRDVPVDGAYATRNARQAGARSA